MIDNKMVEQYLELLDEIEATKQRKTELEARKEELIAKIHGMFSTEGVGKISVRGVTVSPRRTMRARAVTNGMPALISGLKAAGADALVIETVNATTLSSWVNEFDPERMCGVDELHGRLPEEVRDAISLYEQLGLSVSRSK